MADKDLFLSTNEVNEDGLKSSSKKKDRKNGRITVAKGRAYPPEIRRKAILGNEILPNSPSARTVQRWKKQMKEEGTFLPRKPSGGPKRTAITGFPLVLMAVYHRMYPKATVPEIIAFLWNTHGQFLPQPRFYHPSQISRAKQELGISRKQLAAAASQQESKETLICHRWGYWNLPYPFGVADIKAKDLIDIGEACIAVENVHQGYCTTKVVSRANYQGLYGDGNILSLAMAISGDPDDKLRWYNLDERPEFAEAEFFRFVMRILKDLPPGTNERRRCFIMDPIAAYKHPVALNSIMHAGHRFVFRAQTYSNDGPIQSVFQALEKKITPYMYPVDNLDYIRSQIHQSIQSLLTFTPCFDGCGYA